MQIKNVILWFVIPFFFTFNSTTVTAKKKRVIEMKIYDVIYYDTFYLIIGVKDNDIYRVISKETQEVSEGKRISGRNWYRFEVIPIEPFGVDLYWEYKCTCAQGALGESYSVDGLSFVLPYIYSDNTVYYAINTEGLYIKEGMDIKEKSHKRSKKARD